MAATPATATPGKGWPARVRDGALVVAEYGAESLYALVNPRWRRSGATDVEESRSLPGDKLVPEPNWTATRAVTIDVPPDRVWPWVAQLGWGRGGYYGDFPWWRDPEGHVGPRSSAWTLLPEHQHLSVGDVVLDGPGCSEEIGAWRVREVDPGRLLVLFTSRTTLRGRELASLPRRPWSSFDCSWAFVLLPDGDQRTRLLVRTRVRLRPAWAVRPAAVLRRGDTVMQLAMLEGLKRRAERDPGSPPPVARRRSSARDRVRPLTDVLVGGSQVLVTLVGSPLLRRWYNAWGATTAEVAALMPGDELVPAPRLGYTRAVTVDAPVDAVWPWLAQFGQGRGGLYSFDGLENLFGCDIHSADRLLPEHQDLTAGDLVRLGPEGYPCFRVHHVDPPTTLVLVAADPRPPHDAAKPGEATIATWQWQLHPIAAGRRTRLVVRQRLTYPRSQALMWRLVEPVAFVMERQMLVGLARRAERHSR